jgi:uncharacterized protein (DUF1810 family)
MDISLQQVGGAKAMDDPYNLRRFVDAQNPVYEQVCAELRRGRKTSHWMWFIFPQIAGLGHSQTAQYFAIRSREEAAAYLEHPILEPRLRECSRLMTAIEGKPIDEILGHPDDLKFKSSMTLFAYATADNDIFVTALRKYFGGEYDGLTLDRLQAT